MENEVAKQQIEKLLKKAEELKHGRLDLSAEEDLSVAIMNLISIEEHFFFTGAKTGKSEYYDLLNKVREIRKDLLQKIIKTPAGETYCILKHLLAATMRLMEVGTKYFKEGKKKEAEELFSKAYDLYSLFWGINLKLINIGEAKKISDDQLNVHDKEKKGLLAKLGDLVKKLIDCCVE